MPPKDRQASHPIPLVSLVVLNYNHARFLPQQLDTIFGQTYAMLKGCKDSLSQVENLFVEYDGDGAAPQKSHEMLQWISEAGFRYHIKDAWENQPQPFIQKLAKGWDQQLNIFG